MSYGYAASERGADLSALASPLNYSNLKIGNFNATDCRLPVEIFSPELFEPQKGTFFDEALDIRCPEGEAFTIKVIELLAEFEHRKRKRRTKHAQSYRTIICKIMANGLRCFYHREPPLVAYLRKADGYTDKPAWLSGKAMARAINLLARAGLVSVSLGRRGTASTYHVTQKLNEIAEDCGVTANSLIMRLPSERLVRLRTGSSGSDYMAIESSRGTRAWTALLEAYNSFLTQQNIEIALSNAEEREWRIRLHNERYHTSVRRLRPEFIQTDLYRQFNNGSFAEGGRLYGGWWIDTPKHLRNRITINGQATVELDFSGCALRMLYHERGLDYQDDPYSLEAIHQYEKKRGYRPGYYREALKTITQALINDRNGTHPERVSVGAGISFRPGFKRIDIRRMIEVKHAPIADVFRTGAGLRLQRLDSDLALSIITSLRKKEIVALPVHDSFITNCDNEDILKDTMINTYYNQFGFNPIIN